jgi:hypothetical protein
VFGLKSWEITYQFVDEDDEQASCLFHIGNRICTLTLSTTSPQYLSKKKLSKLAFHEVCELFFAEFRIHMNLADTVVDQIIHEKIRTLENILYDDK